MNLESPKMPRGYQLSKKENVAILAPRERNIPAIAIGEQLKRTPDVILKFLRCSEQYGVKTGNDWPVNVTPYKKKTLFPEASKGFKSARDLKNEFRSAVDAPGSADTLWQ